MLKNIALAIVFIGASAHASWDCCNPQPTCQTCQVDVTPCCQQKVVECCEKVVCTVGCQDTCPTC